MQECQLRSVLQLKDYDDLETSQLEKVLRPISSHTFKVTFDAQPLLAPWIHDKQTARAALKHTSLSGASPRTCSFAVDRQNRHSSFAPTTCPTRSLRTCSDKARIPWVSETTECLHAGGLRHSLSYRTHTYKLPSELNCYL
jgi:hypothetical protein